MLWRGVRRRCPRCGSGGLFSGWSRLISHCPGCGMRFEREEGFFLGVYFMNITLTQLAVVVYVAGAFALTLPRPPMAPIVAGAVLIAVVVPVLCHPLSKMLWASVHLLLQPLEPHEQAEAAAACFERADAARHCR
ncbi:MAG: DUF983 domain-containing protein [Actinomycetota bacterium]|nr:DUF983 domain-containing protein [Actinomycetota bacterium]